jgi:hypothetical protein
VAVTIVGGVLILVGLVLLVLPGPGLVLIALGFGVLGTEYAWAAAALDRTKRMATQAGGAARTGVTRAARGAAGGVRSVGRRVKGASRSEGGSETDSARESNPSSNQNDQRRGTRL